MIAYRYYYESLMSRLNTLLLTVLALVTSITVTHADVILKGLDGQKTPFASLQGKWVMINYWAGWCQTCLDEIPEFNRFYKKNYTNVALYAVNYDALPAAKQKNLIRRFNILYPSLHDPNNELNLGDITGVPVTFIFNPQGQLVKTLYGGQSAQALEQAIAGG